MWPWSQTIQVNFEWRMWDSFADSSARLEKLLKLDTKEEDPARFDELAAEIRSVRNEREFLRNSLGITRQPEEE
jgi:hypothetical protein